MDEKQDSPFLRQKTRAIAGTLSGSNPCPSLHSRRSNPLHYRRLLLLSIRCGYIRKLVDGILSRLFLLSRMLNEQKTFTDQALKHGCIGCMFKDR